MSYLILDIETIPDGSLWTPPEAEIEKIKLEKKPTKDGLAHLEEVVKRITESVPIHQDDLAKALETAQKAEDASAIDMITPLVSTEKEKPPFAPIHAHIPIAIGCVWLDDKFMAKRVGCMKIGDGGERELLKQWNEFMQSNRPTIVTWYGRGFDLPVLMLRSFRHGIRMNWYFGDKNYRYRYSEDKNADLCDVMSDFGATRNLKLDAIAQLVGLPGKHDDTDGSQVHAMYLDGKLDEICTYCTDDTVQTAFIYLRWAYLKGWLDLESYRSSCQSLLSQLDQMPNMQRLRGLINDKQLMLDES